MSDLVRRKSKIHRHGVFAKRDFRKGEFILEFRGKIYSRKDNPRGFNAKVNHYMQVGPDAYIGPVQTVDNYVNHSCNPNARIKIESAPGLFAIRKIKKGEEITFDYSTTMIEEDWEIRCNCGSKVCRGKIQDFRYLPKAFQKKYIQLDAVPNFVLKNIKKN